MSFILHDMIYRFKVVMSEAMTTSQISVMQWLLKKAHFAEVIQKPYK